MKVAKSGSVRVGVLSGIPALLRKHAPDSLDKIFADIDLNPEFLEDPENSLSFVLGGRLLESCATHTGLPHFGLLLGQQTKIAQLGPLAELAIHAPNVSSALRSMIMHISVHDRGGAPTLTRDHGTARMGYAIYEPVSKGTRHIYDLSVCMACNILRSMLGKAWSPSEVHFSYARPRDIKPYESFYKAPVFFNADMDTLLFSEDWLTKPIPNSDKQQFDLLMKQFEMLELDMDIGLEEKIRSIVRPLIIIRSCKNKYVAEALSLHPRTLNRRLKNEGVTLRNIVGEIRFEMAKQMLLMSEASVTEISTILGYTDSSILARSFQRWAGTTPSAWRAQNKQ